MIALEWTGKQKQGVGVVEVSFQEPEARFASENWHKALNNSDHLQTLESNLNNELPQPLK